MADRPRRVVARGGKHVGLFEAFDAELQRRADRPLGVIVAFQVRVAIHAHSPEAIAKLHGCAHVEVPAVALPARLATRIGPRVAMRPLGRAIVFARPPGWAVSRCAAGDAVFPVGIAERPLAVAITIAVVFARFTVEVERATGIGEAAARAAAVVPFAPVIGISRVRHPAGGRARAASPCRHPA
jgi:hypothetical protein